MSATIFEKLFGKTILLRPTPEGVLEPVDITGVDAPVINEEDSSGNKRVIEIIPTRVYPVRKVKGIRRIAIQGFGTTQLVDLYSKDSKSAMDETTLANLLDSSYHQGMQDAGIGGELNANLKKTLQIIMILSAIGALAGILIYMR